MTAHDILVERLVRAGKAAGQDALGRVAYQMARRCLSQAAANKTRHIRWVEGPKPVATLYSELLMLEARTGLALDKDELPLADPSGQSALQCAQACLDLGSRIEGSTARVEYLRYQYLRAGGEVEEAADRLTMLLKTPLTKHWYQTVQESRQSALLALGRYEQVVMAGDALLSHDRLLPVAAFNRLTAQAWMGLTSAFQDSALSFCVALEDAPDTEYWSQVIADEAHWLADRFNLDPSRISMSLAGLDSPPDSQRLGK